MPLPGRLLQAGVVLSLLFAAVAAQLTYRLQLGNPKFVALVVCLETAALLALLWPTGGLDSVFIWYAINPILVAATMLTAWWPPGVLGAFLAVATLITPEGGNAAGSRLQTVLIFLLVTAAAQALAVLIRVAQRQNGALQQRGAHLQQALDVQASLYALIRRLATVHQPVDVALVAAATGQPVLGAETVAVCLHGEAPALAGEPLSEADRVWLDAVVAASTVPEPPREGVSAFPIAASGHQFGTLVVFGSVAGSGQETVQGLVDLIAGAVQRIGLDELRQRLAIAAEQQRIAGELHDGVAQQLFNVTSAAYALQQNSEKLSPDHVSTQAGLIGQVAQQAAVGIRQSIRGLTTDPDSSLSLLAAVRSYLETLQAMHHIHVVFTPDGNDRNVSPRLQKALFRIVQEACGNALGHGSCTRLTVVLALDRTGCRLRIEDNGKGFVVSAGDNRDARETREGRGLGLGNMRWLALSCDGDLHVHSAPGAGTVVEAWVPLPHGAASTGIWREAAVQ